ncbi:glycosyltransferase family 39 protein [Candidatus Sumerlaeota bacterium]|nr:glycosyltransferase family 39 protein [Candidatus Sumerlaeota bacterium]
MTENETRPPLCRCAGANPAGEWPFWVVAVLVAVFAAYSGLTLDRIRQAAVFPYQLDAEEGYMLDQALRFADGRGLYESIAQPPYLMDNYPPLYPALWSVFARRTGPSLAPGRWLNAAAALLAIVAVGAIVWTAGRCVLLASLCPMLVLSSRSWLRWSAYARVDVLAVALTLWGLWLFAASVRSERPREWRLAAAALFALALLAKQTVVAAPAACLIWLLANDRRGAVRFFVEMAVLAAIPLLALCIGTRGQYWLHLVIYNRNVMHWNELAWWIRLAWILSYPLIVAIGILAIHALCRFRSSESCPFNPQSAIRNPKSEPSIRGLALAYLTMNVFSFLSLAKSGAAENYLLEPACAVAVFLGAELGVLLGRVRLEPRRWTNQALCAIVLALLVFQAARYRPIFLSLCRSAPAPTVSALIQGDRVVREIESRPGPVLSEDPIYALRAGREVEFQNFIMTQLALEGKWDETPFVRRLDRGEFSLIVAHQDLTDPNRFFNRYTPAMLDAVRRRYVAVAVLPREPPLQTIFLYAPRPSKEENPAP